MKPLHHGSSEISILYVEDDPISRDLTCTMIRKKFPGVTLYSAENGHMGLELFKERRPDIVLTDVSMPVMDGIRMAGEIRTFEPSVPIIVVTAHSDTHYLLDAIKLGISRYVLKPIDQNMLFEAIEECVARITMGRKVREQDDFIRKLSRAVEQSPSTVVITDRRGAIEYVNPKFTRLTGYTPEEAIGENPRILKTNATPPETYENPWSAITAGFEWHGEFLNRKKNGELYWEAASISPLFNGEGNITHFVAVKEDITERKRVMEEVEKLNTDLASRAIELETANLKLEALNKELDAFSHTVSHDLRSPLTNIYGSCQVIKELWSDTFDEQCIKFVRNIFDEAERMDQLITALLDFSRMSRIELHQETVDLSGMAKEIAANLQFNHPERKVAFGIADGIVVNGDVRLLRAGLDNLLGNAWKYTAKKESAVIEFGACGHDEKQVFFVRDTG
ncbi:MAG: response receiver sensor histidine [Geobacteraceae bacterium]|nr:MAG: response receiver sensor histidine [Geobacteraceae bacterium]